MLHVVLYRPDIPQNTGNIARQCLGMKAHLHIVKPIPFDLSERAVRRAGLDYWKDVAITVHEDSHRFLLWLDDRSPWLITSHGTLRFDRPSYRDEDILLFGNETTGLPWEWTRKWSKRTVYVPMPGPIRNYNLANTVGIILAQANLKAGLF